MITSPDGSTSVGGRSGPLGGDADRAVLAALRQRADWVLVGAGTVRAENYRRPRRPDLRVAVVTATGDIDAAPELAGSGIVTLVMPEDGPAVSLPVVRAGRGTVDLEQILGRLDGDFVHVEGGPTLNARLLSLGLVDAFNVTFAPAVGGDRTRPIVAAMTGSVAPRLEMRWIYEQDGFVFVRYETPVESTG